MRREKLKSVHTQIARCRKCPLSRSRKRVVPGEGPLSAKVMFIGQAPGKEEDRTGRPFVGRAGKFLNELLKTVGLERKRIFITSCVKCFPPRNRVPAKKELDACRVHLLKQVEIINPKLIVLLGNVAQKDLAKEVVLKDKLVVSTFHPAAGMRFPKIKKKLLRDFRRIKEIYNRCKKR